jgi:hypothetical protein
MQKKLKRILSLLAMVIVCFGSLPIAAPAAVRAKMSSDDVVRETAEYMARNNIRFESASYEFTESDGRQVYTVSSQDSTVFQSDKPFQKTVSVMNVKSEDGTGGIYVAEASFSDDTVTYDLKRGGETVASAKINVSVPVGPVTPTGPGPCAGDMTWAQVQQRLADALARANATCQMQMTTYQYRCAIYCFVRVYPTDPRCRWVVFEDVAVRAVVRGHIETYTLP